MAHAGFLLPAQQVQLFTSGLPKPIRTDVELQAPTDLQRAMYLARAFEHSPNAIIPSLASRQSCYPPRPATNSQPATTTSAATPSTTPLASTMSTMVPPWPFHRLTPERRREGLCYNCDEPYIRGHKCDHLFYLEVSDFDVDEQTTEESAQ